MLSSSMDSYSQGLGVSIQWSDQAVHIKDFSARHSLPNIVKVTKGQYRNIGVSKSVCSELYLHSVNTISKVLAESVKMKEGKNKVVVSEQKYSLPVTYKGWFELLSQDGKAIKAILSVQELARFFPSSCLVRENMKGYVHRGNGELSQERTRVVLAGEVLTLVGEIWVPFPMGKVMAKRRILKCVDANGEDIFFGLEQKGTFSPIAGQNNISGVHSIKGLLDKFRLPLMVRLVHGVIPTKMERGFTGIFRFVNIYSDENAFVCPLKKDAKMVPMSTREALKVVPCHNFEGLSALDECSGIQRRCKEMLDSYMNSIHILITMPDSSAIIKGKQDLQNMDIEVNLSGDVRQESQTGPSFTNKMSQPSMSDVEEDLLFQEIDGIYQYVREGGVPPAPRIRTGPSALPQRNNSAPKPPMITDSMQTLPMDDPATEIMMKQLDLLEEDDDEYEEEIKQYRSTLPKQDGYSWEEPIYEPLDKIREQKRKLSAQKTGFDTPPDTDIPEVRTKSPATDNNNSMQLGPSAQVPRTLAHSLSVPQFTGPADPQPQRKTSLEIGPPVSSLRQVMKSGSYQDSPRPKSLAFDPRAASETIEQLYNQLPPPLPPKRFDSRDYQSTEGVSRPNPGMVNFAIKNGAKGPYAAAGPQRITNKLSPTAAGASGTVGNSYNTSSSSGSSNSLYPSDKKINNSVAPPHIATSPSSHPPYVAVAKVGDYQNRVPGAMAINNGAYKRSTSVEHSRGQKLHSMYL